MRILCLALMPAIASAAPMTLTQQGRVTDGTGNPQNDTVTLEISLWTDATSTDSALERPFVETFTGIALQDGYYSVVLGEQSNNLLQTSIFSEPSLWVQIAVDGNALSPRETLHTVPRAAHADAATLADNATHADAATLADTATIALTVDHTDDLMMMLGSRSICYAGFAQNARLVGSNGTNISMIQRKVQTGTNIETTCNGINSGWHACGVAKSNASGQNCSTFNNFSYGLSYTSFIRASSFTGNRATSYPSCDDTNAVICCSPQCSGW